MVFGFLHQLQVALVAFFAQFTTVDRGQDFAAGFGSMRAVAESTTTGKPLDLMETLIDCVANSYVAQFPHSRSVDQHRPPIKDDQLPACRCVSSLAISGAYFIRGQQRPAHKMIEERRLPNP